MKYIFAAIVCLLASSARADDIREYIQYQTERLRSYSDAVDYHTQTKGVVVVWIGIPDDDTTFQVWRRIDNAYHVFVDSLPGFDRPCVVVARDENGVFSRYRTFVPPNNHVDYPVTILRAVLVRTK